MSLFRSADPETPVQLLGGPMTLKNRRLHDPENLRANPAKVAP